MKPNLKLDLKLLLCASQVTASGNVLNASQQTAFEHYIRASGGFAGIHSASDTEYG